MAHLWVEEHATAWVVIPLAGSTFELDELSRAARSGSASIAGTRSPANASIDSCDAEVPSGAELHRAPPLDSAAWHLIASPVSAIWVNGLPLLAGFRVMRDRDEIRLADGSSGFFSTEALARVSPMPATDRPMSCPRCRQRVEPESPAVSCPACGLWHHQLDDRPCWTYAPTCSLCPQPTALDAGFQWTPTEL